MFGRKRAAPGAQIAVQDVFDLLRALRGQRPGLVQDDVQIAVGQVAKDEGLQAGVQRGEFGLHLRRIGGNARQRHRHVIRGRCGKGAVDDVGVFAQVPQLGFLALRAGDDAGAAGVARQGGFKQVLKRPLQSRLVRAPELEQQKQGLV